MALYLAIVCVEIFMKRDGMSGEEAVEWMDFNVTGAYVGEQTPEFIFIYGKIKNQPFII